MRTLWKLSSLKSGQWRNAGCQHLVLASGCQVQLPCQVSIVDIDIVYRYIQYNVQLEALTPSFYNKASLSDRHL